MTLIKKAVSLYYQQRINNLNPKPTTMKVKLISAATGRIFTIHKNISTPAEKAFIKAKKEIQEAIELASQGVYLSF